MLGILLFSLRPENTERVGLWKGKRGWSPRIWCHRAGRRPRGLLYRYKYYAENDEDRAALEGKAELVLAKNRNGETGGIPLTFVEELMRFETGPPAEEPQ